MATVWIRTVNPDFLQATLAQLPGDHEVMLDTYDGDVVRVESSHPGFLTFACQQQGYGEVVEDA